MAHARCEDDSSSRAGDGNERGSSTAPGTLGWVDVSLGGPLAASAITKRRTALEGGLKSNPALEMLKKLAKTLHVPVTKLLE